MSGLLTGLLEKDINKRLGCRGRGLVLLCMPFPIPHIATFSLNHYWYVFFFLQSRRAQGNALFCWFELGWRGREKSKFWWFSVRTPSCRTRQDKPCLFLFQLLPLMAANFAPLIYCRNNPLILLGVTNCERRCSCVIWKKLGIFSLYKLPYPRWQIW